MFKLFKKKEKKHLEIPNYKYGLYDIFNKIKLKIKEIEKSNLNKQEKKILIKNLNKILDSLENIQKKIINKIIIRILEDISSKFPILYSFYWNSNIINWKIFEIANILKQIIFQELNNFYLEIEFEISKQIQFWTLYKENILENLNNFFNSIQDYKYEKVILDKNFSYMLISKNKIQKPKILKDISINKIKKEVKWNKYWVVWNCFYIYNEIDSKISLYFTSWLTLYDLNNFITKIYEILVWEDLKQKEVYFIDNIENFKDSKLFIKVLQKNNIKELDELKTLSLKKYLLTIISWWLKIWDYDLYLSLNKDKILSWFAQVQQWDGYKIIEKWDTLNYEDILDDLRKIWVELNGISTLRDISIANWIRFRISIILRDDSFAISIRKMWEWFEDKNFIKNFWFSDKYILKQSDLKLERIQQIEENEEKLFSAWKKNAFFPLGSFLNYKEDIDKIKWLYNNKTGAVIVSWTTGHWKSSLLKTITIDYFNHFYQKDKIRKKVLFFEAPIEHLYRDFSQVSYLVEKPEQLKQLIIASKTQNPQMTVIWETKDPDTMSQLYDLVWLTQAFTTLHKWSVMAVIQYLNEVAKQNNTSVINYLYWTNIIMTQHMVRDIIKNKRWWTLEEKLNNLLNKNVFIKKWFSSVFQKINKFREYQNKMIEIFQYTVNGKIEKLFREKYNIKEITNYNESYKNILTFINKEKQNILTKEIEDIFIENEFILYKENQDFLWNTIWIVNEIVWQNEIKEFLSSEGKTITAWDWTKVFLSLEDDFNENVFSAKLSNEFYKYMKIENYFYFKYFWLFLLWKISYNWSYSIFFKNLLAWEKEGYQIVFIDTILEKIKNNTLKFNNIK